MRYLALCILCFLASRTEAADCIEIQATAVDFYSAYAKQFRMSDGSSVVASSVPLQHVDYIERLLHGIPVNISAATDDDKGNITIKACGQQQIISIFLLASVGNFVTNPGTST